MEIESNSKKKVVRLSKQKTKCPTCKKPASHLFTPFCSKKCSDIDLMKWLSDESYINLD